MKISIVIPTYNEERYLEKTIKSIRSQKADGCDMEIIIVDSNSSDQTRQIAKKHKVKIFKIDERGIGLARQIGLEKASGEIVIFTDADTTHPSDWSSRLVKELGKAGVVFVYGGFRVDDGYFPYYQYINYIQPVALLVSHFIFKTPVAAGQNLAFWKKKAMEVDGFNKKIGVLEDADLAMRMTQVGKVIYIPNLKVISSGRRSKEGWRFFGRMILMFVIKKRRYIRFPDYR